MSDARLRELERACAGDPENLQLGIALANERKRLGLELLPLDLQREWIWVPSLEARWRLAITGRRRREPLLPSRGGRDLTVYGRPVVITGLDELEIEVAFPTTIPAIDFRGPVTDRAVLEAIAAAVPYREDPHGRAP